LCHQPHIVQPLFSTQLPDAPSMVRFSFYSHTFTSPSERDETGRWWNRTRIAHDRPLVCRPRQ